MNIKDYYSTVAARYFQERDSTTQVWPEVSAWLLEQIPAMSRILDAACGPGVESLLFQKAGHLVSRCDLSKGMVEIFLKNLPGVRCQEANLCDLPFLNHEFDVVFASFCFLHLDDTEGRLAISELSRVLEPGGLLFLGTAFGDGSTIFRRHRISAGLPVEDIPFHWWKREDILQILRENDLELVNSIDHRKYDNVPPLSFLAVRKRLPRSRLTSFLSTSLRTRATAESLEIAHATREFSGVSRIVEIQNLAMLPFPVFSATRPRSKMALTVTAGKGLTRDESECSALFEALEIAAAEFRHPTISLPSSNIVEAQKLAAEPIGPFEYVRVYDFESLEPAWAPEWSTTISPLEKDGGVRGNTNGLASGTSFDEACLHPARNCGTSCLDLGSRSTRFPQCRL